MKYVHLGTYLEPWLPKADRVCSKSDEGLNVEASRPDLTGVQNHRIIRIKLNLSIFLLGPKSKKYDNYLCQGSPQQRLLRHP